MSDYALQPHVIYPVGPLVDLVPTRSREMRVYGIEFTNGIVKVGRSKNCQQRFKTLTSDAAVLGVLPTRFFISPYYSNAGRVELAVLATMRREFSTVSPLPEDFPASSEWFQDCHLERAVELANEWIEWETEYGFPIGMRRVDIEAKRAAETPVDDPTVLAHGSTVEGPGRRVSAPSFAPRRPVVT